jgi:hypothetical protein
VTWILRYGSWTRDPGSCSRDLGLGILDQAGILDQGFYEALRPCGVPVARRVLGLMVPQEDNYSTDRYPGYSSTPYRFHCVRYTARGISCGVWGTLLAWITARGDLGQDRSEQDRAVYCTQEQFPCITRQTTPSSPLRCPLPVPMLLCLADQGVDSELFLGSRNARMHPQQQPGQSGIRS